MLADIAVASDRATFRVPELLRGIPDATYAAVLPAHVGLAVARDLLLSARRFDAAEAQRIGVISRLVPHEQLRDAALQAVKEILQTPPMARMHVKRMLNERYGLIDYQTMFWALAESPEPREGMLAFMEKRAPSWVPEEFACSASRLGDWPQAVTARRQNDAHTLDLGPRGLHLPPQTVREQAERGVGGEYGIELGRRAAQRGEWLVQQRRDRRTGEMAPGCRSPTERARRSTARPRSWPRCPCRPGPGRRGPSAAPGPRASTPWPSGTPGSSAGARPRPPRMAVTRASLERKCR